MSKKNEDRGTSGIVIILLMLWALNCYFMYIIRDRQNILWKCYYQLYQLTDNEFKKVEQRLNNIEQKDI